jgi:hypothetical protein
MKFKHGDKLVNVITKETYILHDFKMVETFNHCCGYELVLKKENSVELMLVDRDMVDKLFKIAWTDWKTDVINIANKKVPVKWRYNREMVVMESPTYGKVSSKVHPSDTFDVNKGYKLCKLRMAKKIIEKEIEKSCE